MGHHATLRTVAERVGVSRSTVSNAYNRPDQLSPELRRRILETARELGYPGPDPAARRLRRGRAGAIGLLLTERLSYAFSDPAAVLVLEGLARRCEEAEADLLLIALPPAASSAEAVADAVVDGLCIYSINDKHPAVDAALERRLPLVIVDEPGCEGVTMVGIDDRRGGVLVARHLVELGHRSFALLVPVQGPIGDGAEALEPLDHFHFRVDRERAAGVSEVVAAAGVEWGVVPVREARNTPEAGEAAAFELLSSSPRPTALVALTDQLAFGALRAARRLGLEVPRDLSITGFDDVPDAARSDPPLTTVYQSHVDKGSIAGRLLFELIDGKTPSDVSLPVELVVRASTGPAPA